MNGRAAMLGVLAMLLAAGAGPPAAAAPFPVNPQRLDPYKAFKFRVKWDGRVIYGVSRVGPLARRTTVTEYRDGSDPSAPRRSGGRTEFDAVTLERGVTQDTAFEDWANLVWRRDTGPGDEVALAGFRKDVTVDLLNEAGQLVLSWRLFRCWPSEYQALTGLDANSNGVAMQRLTLQCDGWDRDRSIAEPKESGG